MGGAPPFLTYGSACSGTDLIVEVLDVIAKKWSSKGHPISFHHLFSCDKKASSQLLIKTNWRPEAHAYDCFREDPALSSIFLDRIRAGGWEWRLWRIRAFSGRLAVHHLR